MPNTRRTIILFLALAPWLAFASDAKWEYAGENQGIAFHLRITDACKEGSQVAIRLKSSLDHPVTVSFRLNDSDWRKSFTSELKAVGKGKDAILTFAPEGGAACHPYVDQVYVESKEARVTQTGE